MINVRKELNRENKKRANNHGYFLINEERLGEGGVQYTFGVGRGWLLWTIPLWLSPTIK